MTIMIAGEVWAPPEGMPAPVRGEWATFYRRVWNTYGITPRQYRDLYIAQHGRCFICRKARGKHPDDPKGGGGRRLGVDHNHLSGAVRGLLCSGSTTANTCNRLIARYTVEQLKRAVEYLENEPAHLVLAAGRDHEKGLFAGHDRDTVMRAVLRVGKQTEVSR